MGNRFSRRREAPVSSAGTVITEEKTEAEPATTEEENSEITQTQEAVETEKLEASESEACSPKHERGSKEVQSLAASAPQNDAESESTVKETPPPVQTEPLVSTIKPPEPEGFAKPEAVTEAQLAPKPEPEPPSHQEADAEPVSEPTTAEPLEQYTDLLNQEPLPESFSSSPPLIDLSAPDISSAPASTPASELSNISAAEQHEGRVEPVGGSTLEPEKFTETSDFLEKEEAVGCMKSPEYDVDEENVCDVLQNLELKGNDLLNDLIQGEVKIPEDAPIPDVSTSIELM